MISMNQIWDDTTGFIRRESVLLVPLALATFLVADVGGSLASALQVGGPPNPAVTLAVIAATLWSLVGQLAIMALVLKPGSSVAEALGDAVARLWKAVAIALLFAVAFAVAMIPVATIIATSGVNPALPETWRNVPQWASFYALAVTIVSFWLVLRLLLVNPLLIDRNPGIVDAVRTGFRLTRGVAARLTLAIILYLVVLFILTNAVRFVAGSVFALVGAAIGSPFAGVVLTALVSGVVGAALSLVAATFVAMLYKRVSESRDARTVR